MYQALYRKWRPAVFEDVVGQDHITSVLKSEVQAGKISHAYLFAVREAREKPPVPR